MSLSLSAYSVHNSLHKCIHHHFSYAQTLLETSTGLNFNYAIFKHGLYLFLCLGSKMCWYPPWRYFHWYPIGWNEVLCQLNLVWNLAEQISRTAKNNGLIHLGMPTHVGADLPKRGTAQLSIISSDSPLTPVAHTLAVFSSGFTHLGNEGFMSDLFYLDTILTGLVV